MVLILHSLVPVSDAVDVPVTASGGVGMPLIWWKGLSMDMPNQFFGSKYFPLRANAPIRQAKEYMAQHGIEVQLWLPET